MGWELNSWASWQVPNSLLGYQVYLALLHFLVLGCLYLVSPISLTPPAPKRLYSISLCFYSFASADPSSWNSLNSFRVQLNATSPRKPSFISSTGSEFFLLYTLPAVFLNHIYGTDHLPPSLLPQDCELLGQPEQAS